MANEVWDKPLLNHLPERGYQDNETVASLTSYVDAKYKAIIDQLETFYHQLNPDSADEKYLDYLAYLVGLSDSYYDPQWSSDVKRQMIRLSHKTLWAKKGTLECIKAVLDAHNLKYDIWTDGVNVLPFTLPISLGTPRLRFYIRLENTYNRKGKQWLEAERTLMNFCPAVVKGTVSYKAFILGASVIGDPVFNNPTRLNIAIDGIPLAADGVNLMM